MAHVVVHVTVYVFSTAIFRLHVEGVIPFSTHFFCHCLVSDNFIIQLETWKWNCCEVQMNFQMRNLVLNGGTQLKGLLCKN